MIVAQRFIAGYAVDTTGDESPVGTIEGRGNGNARRPGRRATTEDYPWAIRFQALFSLRFQHEGASSLHLGGTSVPPVAFFGRNRTRQRDENAGHWRSRRSRPCVTVAPLNHLRSPRPSSSSKEDHPCGFTKLFFRKPASPGRKATGRLSLGVSQVEQTKGYIATQAEHHRKTTFQRGISGVPEETRHGMGRALRLGMMESLNRPSGNPETGSRTQPTQR